MRGEERDVQRAEMLYELSHVQGREQQRVAPIQHTQTANSNARQENGRLQYVVAELLVKGRQFKDQLQRQEQHLRNEMHVQRQQQEQQLRNEMHVQRQQQEQYLRDEMQVQSDQINQLSNMLNQVLPQQDEWRRSGGQGVPRR